jgi:hypothetical protein
LVFERRANGREISVRMGSGMLVDEGFAAEEKGSEAGRDGRGKTSLREVLDLKFGGKGLDKNSGDEGENMGERESGTFVASVPLESLGDAPFEVLVLEILSPRNDLPLRLLLRLLFPDTPPIEASERIERVRPLAGSESRRGGGSCDRSGRFGRLSELDLESRIDLCPSAQFALEAIGGETLGDFHWG